MTARATDDSNRSRTGSPHLNASRCQLPLRMSSLRSLDLVTTLSTSRDRGQVRSLLLGLVLCAGASWRASAQAERVRVLARPSAEFAEPFTSVASIRELADRRVLVADPREQALLLVDLRSQHATR